MRFSTFGAIAAVTAGLVAAQDLYPGLTNVNHTCVIKPQLLSCPPANPGNVDTCCTETYGGLLLATQFWNTYTGLESQGQLIPRNTWTLHGPNTTNGLPNGTVVPAYNGTPISTFIEDFKRYDLLSWMNTYWINQGAPNWEFWAHEFSKHATCYSTFQLPCYGPNYVKHQDLIEFFETTIMYFHRFPTWDWLSQAGILPSNTTQVSLSDFQGALTRASKAVPYVGCRGPRYNETPAGRGSNDTGRTIISEAWYYQYAYGRPQEGITVPVNATGSSSNCAKARDALWYYEPTASSVRA